VADELMAIKAVADALQPLDNAGRRHVIAYVAEALGIGSVPLAAAGSPPEASPALEKPMAAGEPAAASSPPLDIRSLKDQKQPRSANEMAALVAYYVSELLPPGERRPVVTAADIEKYFKQANYRLPGRVAQTLPDAARAGYFDAVDRGQYKLNPVGYNLVAHGMPSGGADAVARPVSPRKAAGRRASSKARSKQVAVKKAVPKKANVAPVKRRAAKRS